MTFDFLYFPTCWPLRRKGWGEVKQPRPGIPAHLCAGSWAVFVLLVCAVTAWMHNTRNLTPQPLRSLVQITSAFSVINQYVPFGVMTTVRPEIIIEGSNDGRTWQTYEFNYKPGDLNRSLRWNIPHQPRLDWQLWFAAMEKPSLDSWFASFMARLQQGSPSVLALLRRNPFPGQPPVFMRALIYPYSYATPDERAKSGRKWQREVIAHY